MKVVRELLRARLVDRQHQSSSLEQETQQEVTSKENTHLID